MRVDAGFGAWKVNPEAKVALSPIGLVATTSTVPAGPAGVRTVIWVELCTTTDVAAALPKVIVVPAKKPVPDSVTAVPPAVEPLAGEMPLRVGWLT
jgi:hypothetical protein